jgi:DNA-binding NarL/FixJ family response regulator
MISRGIGISHVCHPSLIAEGDPGQIRTLTEVLSSGGYRHYSTVSRETAIKQLMHARYPDIKRVLKTYPSRFLRSVQTKSPHTRVIYLLKKTIPDESLISDIKTGIRGHIRSIDPPAVMLKAIRSVHGGEIWAERRILEKAISKPMLLPETLQSHVPGLPPLTNREMEMLTLVLQGATNREIADRSSISERTVKTHLYRVYRKLNVKSRTKAIALLSHS